MFRGLKKHEAHRHQINTGRSGTEASGGDDWILVLQHEKKLNVFIHKNVNKTQKDFVLNFRNPFCDAGP